MFSIQAGEVYVWMRCQLSLFCGRSVEARNFVSWARGPYVPLIGPASPPAKHLDVGIWDECLSGSCGHFYPEAVSIILMRIYLEKVQDGVYFLAENAWVRCRCAVIGE